jgi:hypothetical protein
MEEQLTLNSIIRTPHPERFVCRLVLAAIPLVFSGCMVGPNYSRPPMTMPAAYRELGSGQTGETATSTDPNAGEVRW